MTELLLLSESDKNCSSKHLNFGKPLKYQPKSFLGFHEEVSQMLLQY